LVVLDLSSFARNLKSALAERQPTSTELPGHVELQNMIARAAGYRNLQALKAAPPEPPPPRTALPLSDNARRALMQFDADGRLVRWPAKFAVQRLAMWVLWTRFDGKRIYTEREVNAILKAANTFDDHVTLRRELVNHQLLARKSDCSEYRKLAVRPDDEIRALLTACRSRPAADARTGLRAPRSAPRRGEQSQASDRH
jgi:hypothetical protein